MAKLKLLPSLPAGLRAPTRPGDPVPKKGPIGQAQDAGIHAVDWVDERPSLSGTLRWVMFRPISRVMRRPMRTSRLRACR